MLIHLEWRRGELDQWVERLRMQRRCNLPVFQLQQDFGQTGDSSRRFAMAQIRFDRADPAGLPGRARAQRAGQTGDLDRITELGAGAMGLDIVNRRRLNARFLERAADRRLLRARIGHGVTGALAAVIQIAALNHTVNMVGVALGIS